MVDLSVLMPEFAEKLKEFVLEANYQGLICDVFCGFRSIDEQNQLYAQGRTKPGKIVTNAKGGLSWHNWGVAADIVFKDTSGNWTWDVPQENWKLLADVAEEFGLEWGGSWTGNGAALGDTDHFQLTDGLDIHDAVANGTIDGVWRLIRERLNQ